MYYGLVFYKSVKLSLSILMTSSQNKNNDHDQKSLIFMNHDKSLIKSLFIEIVIHPIIRSMVSIKRPVLLNSWSEFFTKAYDLVCFKF